MKAKKFRKLETRAVPLLRPNIDTDCIIPGTQVLKLAKEGFGEGLFFEWRFMIDENGDWIENPEFILNQEPYRDSEILLAGRNFACGSSREPAVWALRDYGIRCVIASSFGHIFYLNSFKNGLLAVKLEEEVIERLANQVLNSGGHSCLRIDLPEQTVTAPDGTAYSFDIPENFKTLLMNGLDFIDSTLKYKSEISRYQAEDSESRPWIYQQHNQ